MGDPLSPDLEAVDARRVAGEDRSRSFSSVSRVSAAI